MLRPRRVVVHASEPARSAVLDAVWRAGHVPWDLSSGTAAPADAIVVRLGAGPGPADLRLPDDASAGPTAYVELRLLTAPEADEHAADDEEAADARPLPDLPAPPALPAPYLVHPYFQSRAFTGRAADLAELDAWLRHGRPARVLVALGGVGKSALAWAWTLRRLADAPWAGCMWWSFYEGGATFDGMLRHLAAYAAGVAPAEAMRADRRTLERQILAALRARPFLLVLDGLERALVAYHRLDAARLPDEVADGKLDLHACTDPRDGAFLRALSRAGTSRLLATTRIFPSDLRDGDGLAEGVELRALEGLDPAELPALLRALRLDPAAAWVAQATRAMATLGHHSLLWRLIAGYMQDEDAMFEDLVDDDERTPAELRAAILEAAFDALPTRAARLLSRLAALRSTVEHDTVLGVAGPPPLALQRPPWPPRARLRQLEQKLAGEQDPDRRRRLQDRRDELRAHCDAWDDYRAIAGAYARLPSVRAHFAGVHADLCLLEARGFLQWDRSSNRYDLHPVVRAHAFENLAGRDRTAAFVAIRDHFERLPPEPEARIHSVADLGRTIEIYSALVGAGDLDAASTLYRDRLAEQLYDRLSGYPTIVELLTPLFPDGLHRLPRLSSYWHKSAQITNLANALALVGRDPDAAILRGLNIRLDLTHRHPRNVVVSLFNWALSLEFDGNPHAALRTLDLAHRLAVAADRKRSDVLRYRAMLSIDLGRWDEAEADLAALDDDELDDDDRVCLARYRAVVAFRRGEDPAPALAAAWRELERAPRLFDTAEWHALAGRVAMAAGAFAAAEPHLSEALQLARRMGSDNVTSFSARLAACLARLDRPIEARRALADALGSASEQFPGPLAAAHLALGERDLAGPLALAAYRKAWADGPPFAWVEDLREATDLLAELGLPPPELPPFDPARSPRLECEEEIERWISELEAARSADD
ncbi:hypothetical protein [Nannocystis pusilla]|uniref:hypothetical protein n=1 Tax=Nannocystis pusilla TaxID=889268 RepID=UPI003BF3F37E